MAQFKYFQGQDNQWYWRLVDGNNHIIAIGGEGYVTESGVRQAVANVITTVPIAARFPLVRI